MPPRRNKNSLIKKQIKLIENRLIQISMVVDDYIYQNKAISSSTAEMYMREVHYYKDKCFEDERSLQVIEKLIRFMKGIIIEQGGENINLDDLNNLASTAPVHSVLDNLSQSTQDSVLSTPKSTKSLPNFRTCGNKNMKIYRDVINTRNSAKKAKKAVISQDSDVMNLSIHSDQEFYRNFSQSTQDFVEKSVTNKKCRNKNKKIHRDVIDMTKTTAKSHITDIVEEDNNRNAIGSPDASKDVDKVASLQKELSNLSITNFDELTSNMVTEECSQSILSGFHHVPEPDNNESVGNKRSVLKPTIQKYTEADKQILLPQQVNLNNKKTADNFKATSHQYEETVVTNKIIHRKNIANTKDKSSNINKTNEYNLNIKLIDENIPLNNINMTKPTTTHNTRNKRQKTTKINENDQAKVKKPRARKQSNKNNSKNKQKNVDKLDISTSILESSRNTPNKADKKKETNIANKKKVRSEVATYNYVMENDLSWIENIRYVREIAKEEYESITLTDDNFWKSFSLPHNWNDDDFLY